MRDASNMLCQLFDLDFRFLRFTLFYGIGIIGKRMVYVVVFFSQPIPTSK